MSDLYPRYAPNPNNPDFEPKRYGVGTLAYLDTYGAFVPVKVTGINGPRVTGTVTAARPGYARGESVTLDAAYFIPRTSVYTRSGMFRIRNDFQWDPSL